MKPGETILVHAAAGGVGLILCQWAKHLGATVIGVVSTPEKAELARAKAPRMSSSATPSLPAEVKRITGGAMVPVVYDSVGKDTFMTSLDCLAPLGMMVSYGNASGPVRRSTSASSAPRAACSSPGPGLATYTAKRADLERVAADLFDVVDAGVVNIQVNQTFPLPDAARRTKRWRPAAPPAAPPAALSPRTRPGRAAFDTTAVFPGEARCARHCEYGRCRRTLGRGGPRRRIRMTALIVACALFMQNLDSTVISTALPTMARAFGAEPIHMNVALTSYLLSLAVFIPASGWMADRFGARNGLPHRHRACSPSARSCAAPRTRCRPGRCSAFCRASAAR